MSVLEKLFYTLIPLRPNYCQPVCTQPQAAAPVKAATNDSFQASNPSTKYFSGLKAREASAEELASFNNPKDYKFLVINRDGTDTLVAIQETKNHCGQTCNTVFMRTLGGKGDWTQDCNTKPYIQAHQELEDYKTRTVIATDATTTDLAKLGAKEHKDKLGKLATACTGVQEAYMIEGNLVYIAKDSTGKLYTGIKYSGSDKWGDNWQEYPKSNYLPPHYKKAIDELQKQKQKDAQALIDQCKELGTQGITWGQGKISSLQEALKQAKQEAARSNYDPPVITPVPARSLEDSLQVPEPEDKRTPELERDSEAELRDPFAEEVEVVKIETPNSDDKLAKLIEELRALANHSLTGRDTNYKSYYAQLDTMLDNPLALGSAETVLRQLDLCTLYQSSSAISISNIPSELLWD